jgi:hypothetical protein
MKTYRGAEAQLHRYWPRYQMEVSVQRHTPTALPPGKTPDTRCIRGWVGLRSGLVVMESLPGFEHEGGVHIFKQLSSVLDLKLCNNSKAFDWDFLWLSLYLKKAVFWDMAPCRCGVNRRFGGTYRLHIFICYILLFSLCDSNFTSVFFAAFSHLVCYMQWFCKGGVSVLLTGVQQCPQYWVMCVDVCGVNV